MLDFINSPFLLHLESALFAIAMGVADSVWVCVEVLIAIF